MNTPLISVIVPVYNVERYLPRCIESVLKQTYTNFELILVDDGTPDRSGIICDRYAEKDSRIRVIHKENGGVSTARNAGIDVAKGEWVTFVDSDDWVSENYLEMLEAPFDKDNYDLIVGSLEVRSTITSKSEAKERSISLRQMNVDEILNIVNGMEFCGPCLKLFSKDIINKASLRFPVGIALAEDTIFVNNYLQKCENVYVTNKPIYYYNRLNELSVIYRNPFFEERALWDQQYFKSYVALFSMLSKDDRAINTLLSREAIYRCCANIKSIIKEFDETVAKEKISVILPQYSCWIFNENEWLDIEDNSAYGLLAQHILNGDTASLYERFLGTNKKTILLKVKRIVKRFIKPFIERYRDGLIKFKF